MHGRIFLIAALMALAPATTGLAKEKVTSAETFENFNEKFCSRQPPSRTYIRGAAERPAGTHVTVLRFWRVHFGA